MSGPSTTDCGDRFISVSWRRVLIGHCSLPSVTGSKRIDGSPPLSILGHDSLPGWQARRVKEPASIMFMLSQAELPTRAKTERKLRK